VTDITAVPETGIELTACWGNGDAESTISVSDACWQSIRAGAEYEIPGVSVYEGSHYQVTWSFSSREVSIYGDDACELLLDYPIEELIQKRSYSGMPDNRRV